MPYAASCSCLQDLKTRDFVADIRRGLIRCFCCVEIIGQYEHIIVCNITSFQVQHFCLKPTWNITKGKRKIIIMIVVNERWQWTFVVWSDTGILIFQSAQPYHELHKFLAPIIVQHFGFYSSVMFSVACFTVRNIILSQNIWNTYTNRILLYCKSGRGNS